MSTLNFFTQYIKGKWFVQNNIYLLSTKKRVSYLRELNIEVSQTSGVSYITNQNRKNIAININNQYSNKFLSIHTINKSNKTTKSTFKHTDNSFIKVNYATIKKKYYYEEYMYIVNTNLIFSIGILKNKYNYSYSGIIITSYIKLKT